MESGMERETADINDSSSGVKYKKVHYRLHITIYQYRYIVKYTVPPSPNLLFQNIGLSVHWTKSSSLRELRKGFGEARISVKHVLR